MSLHTNAILRKGTTIEDIRNAMVKKYTYVSVHSSSPDFMWVTFNDGDSLRNMAVSFTNSCERENGISGTWVSLGYREKSVETMKYLCECFGGFIDESGDESYYPINFEAYSKGSDFTKLDLFKHKLAHEIGYHKLNSVMQLIEEYLEE